MYPSKYSSWWRRLKDVFRLRLRLQKTSSRRLRDVLIKTNMFALALRLQKTSSRRLGQDQYIRLGHTSSRHFQDVLPVSKTFSRRLQDVLQKRLKDIFKASSRRFEDVFKTSVFKASSRHLQDVFQRYLQDFFKTYHQVKLFLLTPLWEAFNTFLRRSFPKTVKIENFYHHDGE